MKATGGAPAAGGSPEIQARVHESGFRRADSNFYALTTASDGRIYYTLSSHNIDTHARAYRFDPRADRVEMLFDFGEAAGETGRRTLPQGKSHTPFFEIGGKLYLATHYGYFAVQGKKETLAAVPAGYRPYPGGHIFAYDPRRGAVEDLARGPSQEGIITLGADRERGRLYGLTWPGGRFLAFDIAARRLEDLGPVSGDGEVGEGDRYFCLCRSFAVWPHDGSVFFTNADGTVLRHRPGTDRVEALETLHLRRDIFGAWNPHEPGHQGYNWRVVLWHEASQLFYGVHPRSGWLFSFDPARLEIELIERICCDRLRRSGGFEPFRYGYLSLNLGPDGETLYYLTGEPRELSPDEHRFKEWVHLVTYNLRTRVYRDHGHLRLEDGRYPTLTQCLAAPAGGRLYSCPWIEKREERPDEPRRQCDLISSPDPLWSSAPKKAAP